MVRQSSRQFVLGFFSSFSPPAWHAASDRLHGADWASGAFHSRLAKRVEEECFDFLFFEDTSSVSRIGGSMDLDLANVYSSPKNDPVALLPFLAAQTERLGLVATASTSLYPPYLLARALGTLDSLSGGRIGWNIVTTSEKESAQNFGMDDLPPVAERYDRADEFVEVVSKLWDSWEAGAVIADVERGIYTDPAGVREIAHEGRYFKVRGPLNSAPSPQGRPVFVQAGGSDKGRDFAAKHAEIIMSTTIGGVEAMKSFREDVQGRMKSFGRDPRECKILYLARVNIADSMDQFRASITDEQIRTVLGTHSAHLGIDLTRFDMHKPIPQDAVTNGTTSMFDALKKKGAQGQSIRDVMIDFNWGDRNNGQIGKAGDVADYLIDMMEEAGGDGYLIGATKEANANFLSGIFDGLVPALKERGAMQRAYGPGATLRERLFGAH